MKTAVTLTALTITTIITGCAKIDKNNNPNAGRYAQKHDSGPKINLAEHKALKIPDAVPRVEPKSRSGNPKSYVVFNKRYNVLNHNNNFQETGTASWYGTKFHGATTSSGEQYDMYKMTAAHKTLPLPTYAEVTNLDNGKKVIVKINDRGPFHGNRVIDLSYAAAIKLGYHKKGTARVKVKAIDPHTYYKKRNKPVLALTTPEPANTNNYKYLQLGAFSSQENANSLANKFKSQYPVKIEEINNNNSKLYKVKLGPIAKLSELQAIKSKLDKQNHPQTIMLP